MSADTPSKPSDTAANARWLTQLREMLDLVDSDGMPVPYISSLYKDLEAAWYVTGDDPDTQRVAAAKLIRTLGGKWDKTDSVTGLMKFTRHTPTGLRLAVMMDRDLVCERVVVGTRTVTEEVPDPAFVAPTVEVTREVEVVEWRCGSLLAEVTS